MEYFKNITIKKELFLPLFLLLLFSYGCATRNINYSRNKILKKYSKEYKILLDSEQIDLRTVFLDNENIKNIQINKRTKELKITQSKPSELVDLKSLILNRLPIADRTEDKKKIGMVVINGIVIADSLKYKLRIDPNAIKSFQVLSQEKMICFVQDGNLLVIITKD